MKYRKLELLFLAVGVAGVFGSIVIAMINDAALIDITGQALFVPVLFFALHYGRRYGYVAASCAALIFLIAKTVESGNSTLDSFDREIILAQAALFGLVGIIGGELAGRIKYIIIKFADEELIDQQTQLFSELYVRKLVLRLLGNYERHQRRFSLIFITMNRNIGDNSIGERTANRLAGSIRSNVRIMDEIGFLDDGRFCLILPDTQTQGAHIVLKRLADAYKNAPHPAEASVDFTSDVLTMPEDATRIEMIANEEWRSEIIEISPAESL